ncbi:MAG TPA: hypothetical protein VJ375_16505, partial [Gaiellaceae bacterium]|nr:hypothetical protein [Gaiellaceae bacterium]
MADWVTISARATAGGTLVLAGATFASVRSANRAARAAERSMLAGMRPLQPTTKFTSLPGTTIVLRTWAPSRCACTRD